jgi:hypothetical protein
MKEKKDIVSTRKKPYKNIQSMHNFLREAVNKCRKPPSPILPVLSPSFLELVFTVFKKCREDSQDIP